MKFKPKVKSYKHQREFVQWYWRKTKGKGVGSRGGAAFFDPGTGKTKTGYDFISAGYKYRKIRRVLVLCPINAIQVWDEQADVHIRDEIPFRVVIPDGKIAEKAFTVKSLTQALSYPDSGDELTILILNYAATIKRDSRWEIMKALEAYHADVVILDESHHIKNATAKQTKAAHRLCGLTQHVLLLTGTPIGKNYLDLYSQLKAIDDRIWRAGWTKTGKMSWTDFRNEYAVWGGRTGYELRGYRNLDDLRKRYRPHIRSARKEDIHDMPKVTDAVIPVELNATARRVYDIFTEEGLIVHKRHLIEAPIPLTKLLRLQQMTGGWVHDEHGEVVELHQDKLSALSDLLSELASAGQSVLVFARFLAEIEAIRGAAEGLYGWVRSIQGGVSQKDRNSRIQQFQKAGPNCLVIQVGAAEALDGLQNTCSYGVFYSTDYSLIHWNQARGRLDRVGQKRPVTFYHLQARSTVDSLILTALKEKKDIERIVMDHPEVLLAR